MSPAVLSWHAAMADRWSARAAELRARAGAGDDNRAFMLEHHARSNREFCQRHNAPVPATAVETTRIAELEVRLAEIQPRPGPYGLIINGGEIMDRVRDGIARELARLRGDAAPEPTAKPALAVCPPAEARPFSAGPQLDLFGLAA
ncbi:hypothetical protein [Sphingomonas aerophila]|uniref:Uncharacterized protein n=1 Tax=Sphingomonas aerophila TaxID=1344948 RepID=A0A7W9EUM8_9SPHN|nr:hypothetical protein [Sphingomonas aerophila]MBB5715429.1 hypothetical protein [Sphingomonas aerophila]